MANKLGNTPNLPQPLGLSSTEAISNYLIILAQSLLSELRNQALRLNNVVAADGTETPTAPVILKRYPKASLPSTVDFIDGLIIVNDDVGGLTPAFSDGTNWRRTADRAVIS